MEESKRQTFRSSFFRQTGQKFAPTEIVTGTLSSFKTSVTGPMSQWQKEGKFEATK